MVNNTRYNKEREFHNKILLEETRKECSKFYAITHSSRAFYNNFLKSHCKNKKVLDYGCGKGSYTLFLASMDTDLTGIDISNKSIEEARQRSGSMQLKNVKFFVMNAEEMDFENDAFDLIFGAGILHHLDIDKSLLEVVRTLKPDGSAIFIEPLGHNPIINLYRKLTPNLRTEDEHPLLMKDLKTAENYFEKVEPHFFHLNSLIAVPFRGLPGFTYLLNVLEALDRLLFRLFPMARKYAWTAVIVLSRPKKHISDKINPIL